MDYWLLTFTFFFLGLLSHFFRLAYPRLNALDSNLSPKARQEFDSLIPVESLSVSELRDLFKNLHLQKKDFDKEDLVRYEARVNTDLNQICFPVRCVMIIMKNEGTLYVLRYLEVCNSF